MNAGKGSTAHSAAGQRRPEEPDRAPGALAGLPAGDIPIGVDGVVVDHGRDLVVSLWIEVPKPDETIDWDEMRALGIQEMGTKWWDQYGEASLLAAMALSGDVSFDQIGQKIKDLPDPC